MIGFELSVVWIISEDLVIHLQVEVERWMETCRMESLHTSSTPAHPDRLKDRMDDDELQDEDSYLSTYHTY